MTSTHRYGSTAVIADADNSLRLVLMACERPDVHHNHIHMFCGRMFHSDHVPKAAQVHRAITAVKNAADISMSFQSRRLVEDCLADGCDTVLLITRDAAFDELHVQLSLAYPEARFFLVSNPDQLDRVKSECGGAPVSTQYDTFRANI